jgi:hypothetical protein
MAMLLMVRAAAWVFLSVAVLAMLDSPSTWLPNANVEGVKVACANADPPGTRKKTNRAVHPKNRFVSCFAGPELEQGK